MTDALSRLVLIALVALPLSGCVLAVGATAGAVAGSEIAEDDGEFDPLENTEAMRTLKRALP
jgi:hypothetical protein